jgi:low affinity Fe/Cu permease
VPSDSAIRMSMIRYTKCTDRLPCGQGAKKAPRLPRWRSIRACSGVTNASSIFERVEQMSRQGTSFAWELEKLTDNFSNKDISMPQEPTSSTAELGSVPDTSSPAYASGNVLTRAFDTFASAVTRWAGSPVAFALAVLSVVVWGATGPLFHYSENWQLVINTGTTIITFVMVFLIQQSQNKDSVAVHLKLNELISSHRAASDKLIGIEDASEDELRRLAAAYLRMASNERPAAAETRKPTEADVLDTAKPGQPASAGAPGEARNAN